MSRLACLVLLTLVVACGGGAGVRPTPTPATLEATPAAVPTPGVAPPAGVREDPERPASGASAPESALASVVRVGAAEFAVEPAVTPAQRIQGLSGRQVLAPGSGMLFIFEQEGKHTFWMKEMRFPLDLVWIGARCTVVDITSKAPAPAAGQSLAELPLYTPVAPARYVLEVNAGGTEAAGIRVGDQVAFRGSLAGFYDC